MSSLRGVRIGPKVDVVGEIPFVQGGGGVQNCVDIIYGWSPRGVIRAAQWRISGFSSFVGRSLVWLS